MLGSKTVISESTDKIIFPRGKLLDTLSEKSVRDKFQRETNPRTKKQTVQLGGWPSWDDRIVLILSATLLSQDCIELALVSYRSELPLDLYNKNRVLIFPNKVHGFCINDGG